MRIVQTQTAKGPVSSLCFEPGERIQTHREFFEHLMEAPTRTVSVHRDHIHDSFFDLKTGFAGEVLQKVSNYRKRLILLGDFSRVESRSLRDFIYECNRGGQVLFVTSLEQALELLD